MESKKGVKQIGPLSFLYANANDCVFNINLLQSESSIYIRFIKMKMKGVLLYEAKVAKEELRFLLMKGLGNSSGVAIGESLLKELSFIVYNQSFTVKEERECLRLSIILEAANKGTMNKVIELKQVTQNDSNKNNDSLSVIAKLMETIDKQNDIIAKLEKNEIELLTKVSNLEKIIKITSEAIHLIKQDNNVKAQPSSGGINQLPPQQAFRQTMPLMHPEQPKGDAFRQTMPLTHTEPPKGDGFRQTMPLMYTEQPKSDTFINDFLFQDTIKGNIPNTAPYKAIKHNPNEIYPNNAEVPAFDLVSKNDYTILYTKQSNLIRSPHEMDAIYSWMNPYQPPRLTLIYQGSRHGFSPSQFHNYCDDAGATLTIIQAESGLRFGGFTQQSWKGEECYKADPNAFLFNLDKMRKFPIRSELVGCAVYCRMTNLVVFGNGYDLCILDKTKKFQSLSNFPVCYGGYEEKFSLTGGRQQFAIVEMETYLVEFNKNSKLNY